MLSIKSTNILKKIQLSKHPKLRNSVDTLHQVLWQITIPSLAQLEERETVMVYKTS